ncbi:MAG: type II toxin-antitoxin system HicB family antitoxin [Oscillospiraceae bacterium]|nr:type II toxin-antitoxin system HicB family antitoxin [Oscillospiraceae bacterium]
MINQLHYKGYVGSINFTEEDGVFFGEVLGISASMSFEGDSVKTLTEDFRNAVDEYLEFCDDRNIQPEKNTFSIRLSPETYNAAFSYASQKGLAFNAFIEDSVKANIRV